MRNIYMFCGLKLIGMGLVFGFERHPVSVFIGAYLLGLAWRYAEPLRRRERTDG